MSLVRRLLPPEGEGVHDHLRRLDPDSRYDRFCGFVNDDAISRYCASIDWLNGVLFGWFEEGVLRAAVQLVPLGLVWPREAELAVTVEPGWQNRGIGTSLCRRALLSAQNRAISRIRMICLQENDRMQRIVRRLQGQLLYVDGAVEGALEVPPPNMLSLWQEAFGESGALLETLVTPWRPGVRDQASGMGPCTPAKAGGRRPAA